MKAMVLAAGVGSRLDPLTRCAPKPMVPVVNRPVVEHIVRLLQRHGFDELVMNLHYLGEQLPTHLGSGSDLGVQIRYEREDQLWGDAGSVRRMSDFFDDTFLVVGGDALCDTDFSALIRFHRERKALATISLYEVEDPSEYGIVEVDETGRVTRFQEKPHRDEAFSRTANMGMYVLEPAALEFVPPGEAFGFGRDLLPRLLEKGLPLYAHTSAENWRDVGSFHEYRQAHWDALAGQVALELPGTEVRPGIWIGDACDVDPSARLEAPTMLGRACRVGAGARIGPHAVVGDGCLVGAGAALHRSILWNGVEVADGTVLEGCILTHGARAASAPALFHGIVAPAVRPR